MSTIKDVASHAGVSTSTVSHVMNDTRIVLPNTKQAVLDAVRDLNYRPSAIARGLSTKMTNTIGVVIADITSPFFAMFLRFVENELSGKGYKLIVCNTYESPERELINLKALDEQRIDGLLITPTGVHQDIYELYEASQTPIVHVDRLPPGNSGLFVGTDNAKAAKDATRYLIELGHTRVGLITTNKHTSAIKARIEGFQQALHESGLPLESKYLIGCTDNVESACAVARNLLTLPLPESPTALITGNHISTLGALKAIKETGRRLPEDLSFICFDNSPWTEVMNPPLTAVQKPINQLAQVAVDTLLKAIKEKQRRQKNYAPFSPLPTSHVLLNATLVIRESCQTVS